MKHLWAFDLIDLLQLRRAGCSPDQIDQLTELKRRVGRGEVSEFRLDTRRMRFIRWLINHGRLSDAHR